MEFSPSHVSIGFSQIAFPTTVLPKDDRTDFAQEERLDLPYCVILGQGAKVLGGDAQSIHPRHKEGESVGRQDQPSDDRDEVKESKRSEATLTTCIDDYGMKLEPQ